MVLKILLITLAHAGWFSDFCEKNLIADDAYRFENVDTEWLGRRIEHLEIRRRWRALDKADEKERAGIQEELRRRAVFQDILGAWAK